MKYITFCIKNKKNLNLFLRSTKIYLKIFILSTRIFKKKLEQRLNLN